MINRIEKVNSIFKITKDCEKPVVVKDDGIKSSCDKNLFQSLLNEAAEKEKNKKNDLKDEKENHSSTISNDTNLMSLQQAFFLSSKIIKKDNEKESNNNKIDSVAKAYGL